MRKTGIILPIVLALVAGGMAAVLAYSYLKSQLEGRQAELIPIVVASKDLTFGETLKPENMKVVKYPKDTVPKGAYSTMDSLLGQTTKVFLMENEPVLSSKLSSIGGGLSLLISPTMRATSIQVDKVSGVSGFVLPGDKVDVIATVNRYGGSDQSVSTTILQKIDVLAAGEKTQQKSDKVITVQSVTLLVDPAGAQTLALATQEGKITLVLRNPNDTDTVIVTAVNSDELMGKKKVVPPRAVIQKVKEAPRVVVPPPPKQDSVAILRGSNKIVGPPAMSEQGK
jgi:pilus assembly protein CpaB